MISPALRLKKIQAMSPREVFARLRYRISLSSERRRWRRQGLGEASASMFASEYRGQASLLESRRRSRARWFSSLTDAALRDTLMREYAAQCDDTRQQAARARAREFAFFGETFTYPGEVDWHADPVTKARWPAVFHADVPVHGGNVGYGDVKHVWEINRHQFLIDLAKAHFLDRDAADANSIRGFVRSWIAHNPVGTGVNWSCALEPAFRLLSWMWAYYLVLDALEDDFHAEWLAAIHDHAAFISRHLELYSSPYNHLIGEATALFIAATCFPEFRRAAAWRQQARAVLEQRLPQQFYADGGTAEQSTFYHHATTGFYILASLIAKNSGEPLSAGVDRAIERAIDFSAALVQPDGTIPEIGGADDGKPIRMEHRPLWDFRAYYAIGAVLFERPDLKARAAGFHEDALWLLGTAGLSAYRRLPDADTSPTRQALSASGYVVTRSDWSAAADYLCFDAGEQAAGMRSDGIPNSMHGHADCLAVVVWLRGKRVLVDSGFYAYNCGGAWESHFRETAAHNTARIDGADQARHISKMAWSHSYRATLEQHGGDDDQAWAVGTHDGYARQPLGVTHRRAVWRRPDHYVVLVDQFDTRGQHQVEVNYQFAPGALEQIGIRSARYGDAADMAWCGTDAWSAEASCGGADPSQGWIASSLGVRRPAPRLSLRSQTRAPGSSLLTVLASPDGPAPRLAVVDLAGGALMCVSGVGYTDCILVAGITPRDLVQMDSMVAIARLFDDGRSELIGMGDDHRPRVDAARLRSAVGGQRRGLLP